MNDIIPRPEYLQRLIQHRSIDLVKIITGLRRSGKSTLLSLFHEHLLQSGVPSENILHMNLESLQYSDLTDHLSFYKYIMERLGKKEQTYLLLDEIQEIPMWEKAIESLRLDCDMDIYITGSNAYMLSAELATLLSGRYVEIRMLPLSFREFLSFHEFSPSASMDERFGKYIQFGGMPILRQYKFNESRSNEALEGIYSTVVLKDILQKNPWANQDTLEKIIRFLCSNVGNATSPNKIGNILTAEGDLKGQRKGQSIAGHAVAKYIRALQDAFVFYHAERYDIRGKQHLKTLGKEYLVDIGFRNMLLGYRDMDRGHILENLVYLELLRRDYHVFIGKMGEAEIDFIATRPQEKLYIQVTETLQSEETRARELRPLQLVRDNYPKIILTMDRVFLESIEGIQVLNLVDWLAKLP